MSIRKIYPAIKELLDAPPKKLVLSGPSGFLGSKVLDTILEVHKLREENNEEPGQVILLTSSPGGLMGRLSKTYGVDKMKTVQASRVDYYSQHNPRTWRDHLGSLGLEGSGAVFVNLAAVAGPTPGKRDPMMDVNYYAPVAASQACLELGFSHWIQSSTQAINSHRAGQVLLWAFQVLQPSLLTCTLSLGGIQ